MALIDHGSALGQEILAFEATRQAALIAADPAALARILHDDLTHVHSSGQVHGKGEFIAHVGRMGGFVAITRGALELRSLGDGVLITGPSLNCVRRIDTGELVDLDGFSAIAAVRTAERWQVLLSQMTLLRK